MTKSAPSPWWDPSVHADRRPFLLARARIASAVRAFFAERGFLEVDVAALQVSPGNEAHLHGFATELRGPDGHRRPLFLHTSPEFACKKLLAAGERRIFAFGHVFRNRERGALHHPEFTMLEWYRAGEPYEAVIADTVELVALAALTAGTTEFRFRDRVLDPHAKPERVTVAAAFARHANIDLLSSLDGAGAGRDRLATAAQAQGVRVAADDTWSDIFSKVLVERVEPNLGSGRITVIDEYPVVEAALARAKPGDPRVAERFELYGCGVELANGFAELTDAHEQRRRFAAEMAEKQRVYGESYPVDEDLLAAVGRMPPASGVALGFDRLVMLAAGAQRIEDVIWTPVVDHD